MKTKIFAFILGMFCLFSTAFSQSNTLTGFNGKVQFSSFADQGPNVRGTLSAFVDQTNQYFASDIDTNDIAWDNQGRRYVVVAVISSNLTQAVVDLSRIGGGSHIPTGVGFVNRETSNGLSLLPTTNSTGISSQLQGRVLTHNMEVLASLWPPANIYNSNGTITGTRTIKMSGSLLLNNETTATSSTTKIFNEIRQKWPGNSSKWFSISDFYEARNAVAINGYPTFYKLAQWNGGSGFEWTNGTAFDSINNVFTYLYGGRFLPSFLEMRLSRPTSGIAYQGKPGLQIQYLNGNGISTSEVVNITATSGLLFSLRQDGRITFGNNGASYYFPIVSPSSLLGHISRLTWASGIPSFQVSQHGVNSGTTDGSGDITITFSSEMPDVTYLSFTQSTTTGVVAGTVHTKATGSMKVRFYNPLTGGVCASCAVSIDYKIEDY